MAFGQTATLGGKFLTSDGDPVGLVRVSLEDQAGNLLSVTTTSASGTYTFPGLNTGNTYRIVPQKEINPLNGVSTFDLVIGARHILGQETITDPFKILAADVNDSASLTTWDLVTSRRLILGMVNQFPSSSWKFFRSTIVFANPQNPFTGISGNNPEILLTQDETNFDFIGVKTGDLNNTATPEQ
ncbi:MAG: hypothetical protein DHS20C18_26480 [Saprospiraceae bacterium]|nr:MAG: hypothetical protein DHS20C18_26480 [Saprospiraceae bacterium]